MRTIFTPQIGGMQESNNSWLNNQNRQILSNITAGPGINIQRVGENLMISSTSISMGGGMGSIPVVKQLPQIPTNFRAGVQRVYWATASQVSGATGDGQVWESWGGMGEWYPQWMYTSKSGVPV